MTPAGPGHDWRVVGAPVVEIHHPNYGGDAIAAPTTITKITKTQIVTADDTRYNRDGLYPVAGGRYSRRELTSIHDPRVITVMAQQRIRSIAQQANNLADITRRDPHAVLTDLTIIERAAHDARRHVAKALQDADHEREKGS